MAGDGPALDQQNKPSLEKEGGGHEDAEMRDDENEGFELSLPQMLYKGEFTSIFKNIF